MEQFGYSGTSGDRSHLPCVGGLPVSALPTLQEERAESQRVPNVHEDGKVVGAERDAEYEVRAFQRESDLEVTLSVCESGEPGAVEFADVGGALIGSSFGAAYRAESVKRLPALNVPFVLGKAYLKGLSAAFAVKRFHSVWHTTIISQCAMLYHSIQCLRGGWAFLPAQPP